MEEKERYINLCDRQIKDTQDNSQAFMGISSVCKRLNNQSNRIKELVEENQQLKERLSIKMEELHIAYCGIENVKTKNGNLKEENKQLKQSQKQIAIIELEKTKICCEKYAEELYDNLVDVVVPTDIDKPKREAIKYLYLVSEVIDDRIKSLKGEIPTIKCSLCGREMVKLADGVNYCCNYCHTQTLLNVLDIGEE